MFVYETPTVKTEKNVMVVQKVHWFLVFESRKYCGLCRLWNQTLNKAWQWHTHMSYVSLK